MPSRLVRSEQNLLMLLGLTDGEGAAVVYEAIGKDTLSDSLDSLRMMGVCVAYGHVSGPPDPIDIIQDLGRQVHSSLPDLLSCLCCETIRFRMDVIYLKPSVMEYWMQI